MKRTLSWNEILVTGLVKVSGYSAIVFVGMILYFLLRESLPSFREVPLSVIFSDRWYPIEDYFGILPLLGGSLIVTLGAMIIAVPVGITTAIYISEIGPRWAREFLKPLIELLAGLPSVVLGFLGVVVFTSLFRRAFNLPTGLTAFTGALLLGGIALPTIISVAEDALDAVPRSYRDGALALGATKWQTIWKVTLPAARTGVARVLGR